MVHCYWINSKRRRITPIKRPITQPDPICACLWLC
uniref:Uncharacterized protein n=1 Tax=Rhizophora mucronata TaxID=61149 RepID=A0A2P2QH64_RHIMU